MQCRLTKMSTNIKNDRRLPTPDASKIISSDKNHRYAVANRIRFFNFCHCSLFEGQYLNLFFLLRCCLLLGCDSMWRESQNQDLVYLNKWIRVSSQALNGIPLQDTYIHPTGLFLPLAGVP